MNEYGIAGSERLQDRTMYTLACRLPRRALAPRDYDRRKPEELPSKLRSLAEPDKRRKQIVMIEHLLRLPPGSVTLYAPSTAKMNAKIAQVKLLIDGKTMAFSDYENAMGEASMTGGLLAAQVRRFFELWGVSIYIDRVHWHEYKPATQRELTRLLRHSLYMAPDDADDPKARRIELDRVVGDVWKLAARSTRGLYSAPSPSEDEYSTEEFASGLPFSCKDDVA